MTCNRRSKSWSAFFYCGAMDGNAVVEYLVDRLCPREIELLQAERGQFEAQIDALTRGE
jgi:S-adenosylmethionine/arginine decarboxylase-like enzyme